MKRYALILAVGSLVGGAPVAHAQTAELPPGPLESLQNDFGMVVGDAFRRPDPVINAPDAAAPGAPGPTLGRALRTGLDVPGSIFAGVMQPLAGFDAGAAPAAAAAPAARHRRMARVHRHHMPAHG